MEATKLRTTRPTTSFEIRMRSRREKIGADLAAQVVLHAIQDFR
jgi:hypothetical protein